MPARSLAARRRLGRSARVRASAGAPHRPSAISGSSSATSTLICGTVGKTTSARVPPPERGRSSNCHRAPARPSAERGRGRSRPRRSIPPPLSSTHSRATSPPLSRTTIGAAPCRNAFVISSLATMPSFCAVAASNAAWLRLDCHRHRCGRGDPAQERGAVDSTPVVLCQQSVHRRDRSDACRRFVECCPVRCRLGGRAGGDRPPSASRS